MQYEAKVEDRSPVYFPGDTRYSLNEMAEEAAIASAIVYHDYGLKNVTVTQLDGNNRAMCSWMTQVRVIPLEPTAKTVSSAKKIDLSPTFKVIIVYGSCGRDFDVLSVDETDRDYIQRAWESGLKNPAPITDLSRNESVYIDFSQVRKIRIKEIEGE